MADTPEPEPSHKAHSSISRLFIFSISSLILLAGIIALVLYLVFRPSHPRFSLEYYAISLINSTSPLNTTTATIQSMLVIQNPNLRASIRYDRVEMHVAYNNAPITPPVPLPLLIQDKGTSVEILSRLGGPDVAVSPKVAEALNRMYRPVCLIAIGRIRYELGPFRGRWSSLYVRCDMFVSANCSVSVD